MDLSNYWEFAKEALASATISAALVAALGWLFRSQIGHWLNKDLEAAKAKFQRDLEADKAQYQRDLEAAKAQHQRELETYKVALIADSERRKHAVEVRKAAALRMVDRKFEVLNALHRALGNVTFRIAGVLSTFLDAQRRFQQIEMLQERYAALNEAMEDASPFIPRELYQLITGINSDVQALVRIGIEQHRALSREEVNEAMRSLLIKHAAAETTIRDQLSEMTSLPEMGANNQAEQ